MSRANKNGAKAEREGETIGEAIPLGSAVQISGAAATRYSILESGYSKKIGILSFLFNCASIFIGLIPTVHLAKVHIVFNV